MIKSGEDILDEIETTLDQLIENANSLKSLPILPEYRQEIEALQKTQESLLAHLMHMDNLLDQEKKKSYSQKQTSTFENLEEKFTQFGETNAKLLEKMSNRTVSKQKMRKKTQPKRMVNKKPCIRNKKVLATI